MRVAKWKTAAEIEKEIGSQLRARRLRANRTAADVAAEAGVATKTLLNLERGQGSTLMTLVKVLRAVGAEEWLDQLAPPAEVVSPIAVFAVASRPQRVRSRARRIDG